MQLLLYICLLLTINGLATRRSQAPPVTLTPPIADTKAVLQQAFNHASLAKYLAHYNSDSANFCYEASPVYNGRTITKPTFDVVVSGRRFIRRPAYKQQKHDPTGKVLSTVFIDVTRVNINHDSAHVNLGISNEGVVGLFWLARASGDRWRVVKYSTYEI